MSSCFVCEGVIFGLSFVYFLLIEWLLLDFLESLVEVCCDFIFELFDLGEGFVYNVLLKFL